MELKTKLMSDPLNFCHIDVSEMILIYRYSPCLKLENNGRPQSHGGHVDSPGKKGFVFAPLPHSQLTARVGGDLLFLYKKVVCD